MLDRYADTWHFNNEIVVVLSPAPDFLANVAGGTTRRLSKEIVNVA